jgi:hypothetical protein
MRWIKLTHSSGIRYINLEEVYTIDGTSSPTDITFYDANSILPITYSFASAQEKNEVLAKLTSIISPIDIDLIAPQS